jgi:hypothetical protein
MSQQNVNEWKDKFGRTLEIGQRVAAVKGKKLHVGEVLWFTPAGVTIASENAEGLVKNTPILYDFPHNYWGGRVGSDVICIIS